ncbi:MULTISPECIES: hypothetical protein [unclassified Streptomyces]|uniref:hypothetical protein n=1 Tax=unclassified Streptomyces TaxID=2593676 RepID=UPI00332E2456
MDEAVRYGTAISVTCSVQRGHDGPSGLGQPKTFDDGPVWEVADAVGMREAIEKLRVVPYPLVRGEMILVWLV